MEKTKGQKQTKETNSKGHSLARRTPEEVLKPKCGFISQWGLRRKHHFQGHHMAPKYHEYIPKSVHPFNSTSADILIAALKNKRDCTALEFTENKKRHQK